ncbi:hypothetical protein DIX60_00910 [Streptococcus iniae]|uniref:DUF4097 family beta strand repeat-containing protein n=1 Tax=Streptococcus iniae TaxID=1346 RepID=UPI0008D9FC3C|nr:DUF4097 family beta strand repeat-containing protein [Streptococcus iniae]OHX27061.1 hypothetical protein BKX95_07195 [Streptococcus iniae]RLV28555.1 hypothetical protein DIX60_00910 [Streptococcus iniae]
MKKYEKIIGMIALACLMLALCFGAYGYLSGGIEAEKIPEEHIKNVTQTVKAKKTLRLDSDVNDVTIETYKGKDIKVIYPKSKKNPITITEDDATLQIKDSGNWTKPRTSVHFLTLDLLKDIHKGVRIGFESGYRITILVPKGYQFDDLNLHLPAGSLDLSDISAQKATITLSAGELQLDKVMFKEGDLHLSVGSLVVSNSVLNQFDYQLNTGDLDITNSQLSQTRGKLSLGNFTGDGLIFKGKNTLESHVGDVFISLKELNLLVTTKGNVGDTNITPSLKDSDTNRLEIKNNLGNVTIQ